MTKKQIAFEVVIWIVTAMMIVMFLRAGILKFDDTSGWARGFRNWGFTPGFMRMVGAWEVAAALLLLWPRTAAYGAAAVVVVMIGAAATMAVVSNPRNMLPPTVWIFVGAFVLWARWRKRLRLSPPAALPALLR